MLSFTWGYPQQTAFEFIRDKLLEGIHLAPPDFVLPFHPAMEASEDGKGGELYHFVSFRIDCVHQHG